MSTDPAFLLTGFACEYSLANLAGFLRSAGRQVIEADMGMSPLPDIDAAPLILITSQHPSLTGFVFRQTYGHTPPFCHYSSPLEYLRRVNALCTVFIPHDLEQPLRPDEISYLANFDIYCSPYPVNPAMARLCTPIETGWIKYTSQRPTPFDGIQCTETAGVFFVNQVRELINFGGASYLLNAFRHIVEAGIPFKFPDWPGMASMEEEMKMGGAVVIPRTTVSTDILIGSKAVYANAQGSVLAEARYLGKPTAIVPPHTDRLPTTMSASQGHATFNFGLLMDTINAKIFPSSHE
jgi:hypothetical protein